MRIGVFGCGNMASALIENIHRLIPEVEFHTYTPSKTRSKELSLKVSGVHHDTVETMAGLDLYIIGCKPQQVKQLASSLSDKFNGKPFISILAGTSCLELQELFCTKEVCRVMPNTPSLYGEGIELIYYTKSFSLKNEVHELLKSCGDVYQMESEDELDRLTVYSGSGPAYIFYLAKCLEDDLLSKGFSPELSSGLIRKLFTGSSKLIEHSNLSFTELIDNVTCKGGVTIEAIKHFDEKKVPISISGGLEKAFKRAEELKNLS